MSETKVIDIKELKFDEHNFNRHNDEGMSLLEKSIKENGLGRSILLDKDNNIVGGNGVTEKAIELGKTKVRIIETDGSELIAVKRTDLTLDSEQGRKMALADNSVAHANLEWNEEELQKAQDEWGLVPEEWGVELPDFGLSDEQDVKSTVEEDNFEIEDNIEKKVNVGDIWQLGRHRLMCGDSTNTDDIKRLLVDVTPDLIYTDPPYGMSAVSSSGVLKEKYKTDILGDEDNTIAMNAFKVCQRLFTKSRQVWWGANYYTECLPSSECWLVWDKNNGMSDQTDCELAWSNYRSVVRQFTMVSEKQNRIHPTQKPCKLFADIVTRMKKNDTYNTVLDLFGGSGSTMIACEQMNINSFTMEYDPHYCDVIIARWEKLTGNKAEKMEN